MKIETAQRIVSLSREADHLKAFILALKGRSMTITVTAGYPQLKSIEIPVDVVMREARKQLRAAKAALKAFQVAV